MNRKITSIALSSAIALSALAVPTVAHSIPSSNPLGDPLTMTTPRPEPSHIYTPSASVSTTTQAPDPTPEPKPEPTKDSPIQGFINLFVNFFKPIIGLFSGFFNMFGMGTVTATTR